jgi:hypothetical protein
VLCIRAIATGVQESLVRNTEKCPIQILGGAEKLGRPSAREARTRPLTVLGGSPSRVAGPGRAWQSLQVVCVARTYLVLGTGRRDIFMIFWSSVPPKTACRRVAAGAPTVIPKECFDAASARSEAGWLAGWLAGWARRRPCELRVDFLDGAVEHTRTTLRKGSAGIKTAMDANSGEQSQRQQAKANQVFWHELPGDH